MRWRTASVRLRLTLWHAAVLTLVICVLSTGVFLFVRARLLDDLERQLERALATVERIHREEPAELADLDSHWGIALFQIVEPQTVVFRTEAWERGGLTSALPAGSTPARGTWASPDGRRYRVGRATGPGYRIEVAVEETSLRRTLWTLAIIQIAGIPCAAGLAVVGGYLLAGRVLAPVRAMADTARRITAESLVQRLPVENPTDEFGRLAGVFNETLSRLQDSFERLRRFTADASHELRTPLTAMRSVGEVALQGPREPATYRDAIGSMLEEVDRLTRLVESLLVLTRADSDRLRPSRQVLDLGALATGVTDHLRVLAEEKEQHLGVEIRSAIKTEADPALLRQGLVNLLDNAIKNTPAKGTIDVRVTETLSGDAAIEVEDTGPGIAHLDRDRIFERFYRVDAARSRDAGGVGLGLAIARWAVEVNGGHIELDTEEGRGSLFRIVLPRADG